MTFKNTCQVGKMFMSKFTEKIEPSTVFIFICWTDNNKKKSCKKLQHSLTTLQLTLLDFIECNGRNKICCDQIKGRKCLSWFSNNIEWELLIGGTKCLGLDKEAIHWNCSFLQAFFASNCKYLFLHFISLRFIFVNDR